MRSKNMALVAVAAVVLAVPLIGTVAYGVVLPALQDGHRRAAATITTGHAPGASTSRDASTLSAAPAAAAKRAQSAAIAQAAPANFYPGEPPFADGGVAADGLSAWGVAFKRVSDPNAQADSALIKAAYQDAEKKAGDLALATGNRLGKVVALTENTSSQPRDTPCIEQGLLPKDLPVPPDAGTSSGSTAPCQPSGDNFFLVVWVYVRHAL